jgi:putative oxidoreductase
LRFVGLKSEEPLDIQTLHGAGDPLVGERTVHLPNGFSSIKLLSVDAAGGHFGQPGYETDLLYLAALVALVIGGSGPLALDRLLLRKSGVAD